MKRISIIFTMKRYSTSGIEETADSQITLLMTEPFAEKILKDKTSLTVEGTLKHIAVLQGYYFEKIKQVLVVPE